MRGLASFFLQGHDKRAIGEFVARRWGSTQEMLLACDAQPGGQNALRGRAR